IAERDAIPAGLGAERAEQEPHELRFPAGLDHEVEEVGTYGAARADELELPDAETVAAPLLDLERCGGDQPAPVPHEHDAGLDLRAVHFVARAQPVPGVEDRVARRERESTEPSTGART